MLRLLAVLPMWKPPLATADGLAWETTLLRAQRMESLGILAGGIAHDFNNLLQVIIGTLALAQETLPVGSRTSALLHDVDAAAMRASHLTDELLAFTSAPPEESRPISLNALLDDVARLLRRSLDPRIRLELDLASDGPLILGDAARVRQAFLNVLLNARDACPVSGRITVRTEVMRDARDTSRRIACVEIADDGVGMTQEVRAHAFEPFFTTKSSHGSTGLGLAMVQATVAALRGSVTIDSAEGRGTTVRFSFPSDEEVLVEAVSSEHLQWRGAETILVVDDEPAVLAMAERVLRPRGYRTHVTASAREAVALIRDATLPIDLVILDLVMPEMSGLDAYLLMRAARPTLRVLLSSGYSTNELAQEVTRRGVQGYLPKPYRVEDLLTEVRRVLDESRA